MADDFRPAYNGSVGVAEMTRHGHAVYVLVQVVEARDGIARQVVQSGSGRVYGRHQLDRLMIVPADRVHLDHLWRAGNGRESCAPWRTLDEATDYVRRFARQEVAA